DGRRRIDLLTTAGAGASASAELDSVAASIEAALA
ncbi:MAG: hypothetical protein JWN91_862, partial [Nocardioides sp.]|nr:hypothetical protein [Nocardioides sp.]